ncbi:MAG TPA: hypothetical protein VGO90_04055 [Chthoniobacteraceae bacterium]|jgi:hypothetical protein|nr:hypothetical protein [Chthoniobacter sp.]HEV7866828.1 hypothetical protein [Chthoniobacteraceae bacterium]
MAAVLEPEKSNISMQTVVDQLKTTRPETSYYGPSIGEGGGSAPLQSPAAQATSTSSPAE